LAAALSDELGAETELIKGDGGIFDVVADGNLVFSKHDSGRFPTNDEIINKLRKKTAIG
jgi:selenoprotein W-related protein